MPTLPRRDFHRAALAGIASGLLSSRVLAADPPAKRKFTIDLVCGAIGVTADQSRSIALASAHGFESVQPQPGDLAKLSDAELAQLLAGLKEKGLVWGAAGLPVDFRGEEDKFQADLKGLPAAAASLKRAGATRVGTWIRPSHATLTYMANFKQTSAGSPRSPRSWTTTDCDSDWSTSAPRPPGPGPSTALFTVWPSRRT